MRIRTTRRRRMKQKNSFEHLCDRALTASMPPPSCIHKRHGKTDDASAEHLDCCLHTAVASVPVIVMWLCTASILAPLGIEASLAHDVGVFMRIIIFGLLPAFTFECLRKYLQVCVPFRLMCASCVLNLCADDALPHCQVRAEQL